MHEFSIVDSLLQLADEHARKNNAKKVTKIVVKIGELSGVEPDLLKTAFETFKEKTICEEAEFVIINQPIIIKCNDCNYEGEPNRNEYVCPKCKGVNIKIIDGDDMYLMSLELEKEG